MKMMQKVCHKVQIFNYKPFFLQYVWLNEWARRKTLALLQLMVISNQNCLNMTKSFLSHLCPSRLFFLAQQAAQMKLMLFAVYRQSPRFSPRLLSLVCSETKCKLESTRNVMGFKQMRHVAALALLMHVPLNFTSTYRKPVKCESRVAHQGSWCFHYFLIDSKLQLQAPTCLPP